MKKQTLDFTILIEQDEEGVFVARVPEIEGCYTQGKSLEEVLERIKEAIEVCLEGDGEKVIPLKFIGIQKMQVERPLSI